MRAKAGHEEHGAEYPQPKSLNAEGAETGEHFLRMTFLCDLCVDLLLFFALRQRFVRKWYGAA
jgi:hypothetical protein